MRVLLLSVFFVVFAFCAEGQSFEGVVVYKNAYVSKIPQAKDEQFAALLGTKLEYSIKGGNYKSVLNGSYLQMTLFRQQENKSYTKLATSDTLYWNDAAVAKEEVISHKIMKKQEKVMGIMCDALVVETKNSVTTYYFNSKYRVDPKLYTNHKFGNHDFVMDKTKSLYLKMVMETPQFTLIAIAQEVKRMKLDDSVFALPEGAVLKESSF